MLMYNRILHQNFKIYKWIEYSYTIPGYFCVPNLRDIFRRQLGLGFREGRLLEKTKT